MYGTGQKVVGRFENILRNLEFFLPSMAWAQVLQWHKVIE